MYQQSQSLDNNDFLFMLVLETCNHGNPHVYFQLCGRAVQRQEEQAKSSVKCLQENHYVFSLQWRWQAPGHRRSELYNQLTAALSVLHLSTLHWTTGTPYITMHAFTAHSN